MQVIIRKVYSKHDLPFDLLLLADEAIEAIEKYIYDSEVYVATESEDSEAIAVFALLKISNSDVEIIAIRIQQLMFLNERTIELYPVIAFLKGIDADGYAA